jgi:hypothetical protein
VVESGMVLLHPLLDSVHLAGSMVLTEVEAQVLAPLSGSHGPHSLSGISRACGAPRPTSACAVAEQPAPSSSELAKRGAAAAVPEGPATPREPGPPVGPRTPSRGRAVCPLADTPGENTARVFAPGDGARRRAPFPGD